MNVAVNERAALFALEAGTKPYKSEHLPNVQQQVDELDDEHVHAAIHYLVHETFFPQHPYVQQVLTHYQVDVPYNRILDGGDGDE